MKQMGVADKFRHEFDNEIVLWEKRRLHKSPFRTSLLNGFVKKWFMQLRVNVNYTTYLHVPRRIKIQLLK